MGETPTPQHFVRYVLRALSPQITLGVGAGVGAAVVGALVGAAVVGAMVGVSVAGAMVGVSVAGAMVGVSVAGAMVGVAGAEHSSVTEFHVQPPEVHGSRVVYPQRNEHWLSFQLHTVPKVPSARRLKTQSFSFSCAEQ